jgi:hypothetical protein
MTTNPSGGWGAFLTLMDGTATQITINFAGPDIQVCNGGFLSTVLATYTGASPSVNVWYAFEIEIVIHNTAGSVAIRKNGNPTNDFFVGSINTRNGSSNNYANRLQTGSFSNQTQNFDDLLWRSGSSVSWSGDIRCYTRMPLADGAVQWSRSGIAGFSQSVGGPGTGGLSNTQIKLQPFTALYAGSINSITVVTGGSVTGNMKAAIWADNAGSPGAVLGSGASQAAVASGNNTFTITPPVNVVAGQKLWIGGLGDTSGGNWAVNNGITDGAVANGSFATFPQPNPVISANPRLGSAITFNAAASNAALVSELQLDNATTYVYSSTNGQSDLYTIGPIANTPSTILGVVTRGYFQKSDAGTRNCAVQLKSGATTVESASTALNTVWGWLSRIDLVDPATSAAWTATGVNNVQIGPIVKA